MADKIIFTIDAGEYADSGTVCDGIEALLKSVECKKIEKIVVKWSNYVDEGEEDVTYMLEDYKNAQS